MAVAGLRCSVLVALVSILSIVSTPILGQGRLRERVLTGVGREDGGFFASPTLGEERLRSKKPTVRSAERGASTCCLRGPLLMTFGETA